MFRAYNIWRTFCRRWTNLPDINPNGYGYPERYSLDQAKILRARMSDVWSAEEMIVVEMDANGKPILPKCIIEKYGGSKI